VRARRLRALVALGAAGLSLSACSAAPPATVSGRPSASIAVPLRVVGCTPAALCVAVGNSSTGVGPSSTGEVREPNGAWRALRVPGLAGAQISSAACWSQGCLLAGSQATGDLVWRFHGAARAMTPAAAPRDAVGISALDCTRAGVCVALDQTASGAAARLLVTSDAAQSWSPAVTLAWTTGLSVTALACSSADDCLVAATDGTRATLERTRDGGVTWSRAVLPRGWRALSALWCDAARCAGLATEGSHVLVAWHQGGRWRALATPGVPRALACTRSARCVVAGSRGSSPWVATVVDATMTSARLRYVPSVPVAASCARRTCAVVAPDTVLSLRP
jgi:hypothetical protein